MGTIAIIRLVFQELKPLHCAFIENIEGEIKPYLDIRSNGCVQMMFIHKHKYLSLFRSSINGAFVIWKKGDELTRDDVEVTVYLWIVGLVAVTANGIIHQ